MARLRYNGLSTTLGASLTNSATAVTFGAALTHAGGAVPTIAGADYIPLSILNADGRLSEIVHLTAYTSGATTGTISRAQEGTTGAAHNSGARVVHGATATDLVSLQAEIDALGNGDGLFRGNWESAPMAVAQTYDFADGTWPAPFTRSNTGSGGPVMVIENYSTAPGGSIPSAPAKHVRFPVGQSLSAEQRLSLSLTATGVSAPVAVRYWWGATGTQDKFAFQRNGTEVAAIVAAPWAQRTDTVAAGDTVAWIETIVSGVEPYVTGYLARVEILIADTSDPYMTGDYVVHEGKLWKSSTDSNASEPGVAGWTEVPLGVAEAEGVSYDNTTSGLASVNLQDAIDEVATLAGAEPEAVAWGAATSGQVGSGNIAATLPAHQAGDLLIFMGFRNDSGPISSAGWTTLFSASNSRLHVLYKIAGASETNPTFTVGDYANWAIVAASGPGNLAPVLYGTGGQSTAISDLAGAKIVGVWSGEHDSSAPVAAPTGWTKKTGTEQTQGLASSAFYTKDSPAVPIAAATFDDYGVTFGVKTDAPDPVDTPSVLLLEVGEDASDVPVDTPIGTIIFQKG